MRSTSFSRAHHRGRMEIRAGHTKGPSWWADVPMLRLRHTKLVTSRATAQAPSLRTPRGKRGLHGTVKEPEGSACAFSRLGPARMEQLLLWLASASKYKATLVEITQ
jgi:hypothetical protein